MITTARLQELLTIYSALKVRIIEIDEKYDLNYHEPKLNMPETLGLTKRVFTPKTNEQLQSEAETATAPWSTGAKAQIDAKYGNALKTIDQKRATLAESLRKSVASALKNYNAKSDALYLKLADNGLLFSTVKDTMLHRELEAYNAAVAELNLADEKENGILDDTLAKSTENYNAQIASWQNETAQKQTYYFQQLVKAQEKERVAVEKYNAQIDEKEVKYQASRERAYENARQAEYDRVYKMAKLYAQLGETGLNRLKINEKTAVSKSCFSQFTKEEAQALLSYDSFLRTHLQDSYSAFTAWVDATLR